MSETKTYKSESCLESETSHPESQKLVMQSCYLLRAKSILQRGSTNTASCDIKYLNVGPKDNLKLTKNK